MDIKNAWLETLQSQCNAEKEEKRNRMSYVVLHVGGLSIEVPARQWG
jgi:hypothetical protein